MELKRLQVGGSCAAQQNHGRVVRGGPGSGDAHCLSVVLSHPHCCGATSFAALLVVDGDRCGTYQEVCGRLGLLETDDEWDRAIHAAAFVLGDGA